MNPNSPAKYTENQLSKIILDAAFRVHTKTGPGLLETVYEVVLAHVHLKNGIERIVNGLPEEPPASSGLKLLSFLASLASLA